MQSSGGIVLDATGTTSSNQVNLTSGGLTGFGVAAGNVSAKVHIIRTSEQLRIGYDTANYLSTSVGSTGVVTFAASGSGSSINFKPSTTATLQVLQGTTGEIVFNRTGGGGGWAVTLKDETTNDLLSLISTRAAFRGTIIGNVNGALTSGGVVIATNAVALDLRGSSNTATSGTVDYALFNHTFAPTSGTAVYNALNLTHTINHTGGANGITRGLYINPTLTAATDYRSIEIVAGDVYFGEGVNLSLGTVTGTQIGLTNAQKLAFFGATPIIQPTTGVSEASFVENAGGTAVNIDSTFGGYTLQQITQALQNLGVLA